MLPKLYTSVALWWSSRQAPLSLRMAQQALLPAVEVNGYPFSSGRPWQDEVAPLALLPDAIRKQSID
jgi:hypothetical protein